MSKGTKQIQNTDPCLKSQWQMLSKYFEHTLITLNLHKACEAGNKKLLAVLLKVATKQQRTMGHQTQHA